MDDRANEISGLLVYNRLEAYSLRKQRELLPIFKHRNEILYLVETQAVTIVCGHTGCGKSTQIPQYLDETGWARDGRIIACTQVCCFSFFPFHIQVSSLKK